MFGGSKQLLRSCVDPYQPYGPSQFRVCPIFLSLEVSFSGSPEASAGGGQPRLVGFLTRWPVTSPVEIDQILMQRTGWCLAFLFQDQCLVDRSIVFQMRFFMGSDVFMF